MARGIPCTRFARERFAVHPERSTHRPRMGGRQRRIGAPATRRDRAAAGGPISRRAWQRKGRSNIAAESRYIMLPGMKQRIEVPSGLFIGQTIVLPALFGSVITASSGTSIHSLSRRTR
jgi:hypothetical protein